MNFYYFLMIFYNFLWILVYSCEIINNSFKPRIKNKFSAILSLGMMGLIHTGLPATPCWYRHSCRIAFFLLEASKYKKTEISKNSSILAAVKNSNKLLQNYLWLGDIGPIFSAREVNLNSNFSGKSDIFSSDIFSPKKLKILELNCIQIAKKLNLTCTTKIFKDPIIHWHC